MPTAKPKNVHQRLAAVQAEVGHVDKTGSVAFGKTKYDYMQEHGLLALVKPLLEKYGLSLAIGVNNRTDSVIVNGSVTTVLMQAVLTNIDDPADHIVVCSVGQGHDATDKGSNKALTGGSKYLLQKLFLIPTEDIDDSDTTPPPGQSGRAGTKGKQKAQVSNVLSKAKVDALRSAVGDAMKGGYVTQDRIQAALQGTFGKEKLNELTAPEGAAFEEWLVNEIASSDKATAEKSG